MEIYVIIFLYLKKERGRIMGSVKFDYSNPVKFAKKNVVYILVCSSSKNPNVVTQVRNYKYKKKKYTPEYMQKMKEYLFKDAYVYTEIEFEREFVKKFQY